jgi:hypothetical protein
VSTLIDNGDTTIDPASGLGRRYYGLHHRGSGRADRPDQCRNVCWAVNGEWLEYQVNLDAGVYAVDTRVASLVSSGAYDLLLDGMVFGSDTVSSTGGWQVWETNRVGSVTVATSGLHTLRIKVTGIDFNLN